MNKQRKASIKAEIDGLRALRKAMRAEPTTPEALAKAPIFMVLMPTT